MRAWVPALSAALALAVPAGQAAAQTTTKQSYCINSQADFYPYKDGENCRGGYQVADGNCRLKGGGMTALKRGDCVAQGGEVVLPAPAARLTGDEDPKAPPTPKPLTVQNPKPQ